jgi:calcineurin-like phosphoesterase family protein
MIHFTSDLHLFHRNIIAFDKRPFNSLEEMHEAIITNWNSVVAEQDEVYFLGDLALHTSGKVKPIVNALKGRIHFIRGNHDKLKEISKLDRFETIQDYKELKLEDGQLIVMSHYPLLVWNAHHKGAWHLHGHCHMSLFENQPDFYRRKVLDVGCMGSGYTPLSLDQVKSIMSYKEINFIDHHQERN